MLIIHNKDLSTLDFKGKTDAKIFKYVIDVTSFLSERGLQIQSKDVSLGSLQKQILHIQRALIHFSPNLIYEVISNKIITVSTYGAIKILTSFKVSSVPSSVLSILQPLFALVSITKQKKNQEAFQAKGLQLYKLYTVTLASYKADKTSPRTESFTNNFQASDVFVKVR